MALTVHGSEFATLEYQSGSNWIPVPGITSYAESGGEAPERDVVAFSGVAKRTGHPRLPSIEMNAVFAPAHSAWQALRTAADAGTVLKFRFTTKKETVEAITGTGNSVAIDLAGDVTFAGNKPDAKLMGPGQVIQIGGNSHVIDTVSDAGAVKVKPAPDPAVGATETYSIVLPSMRRAFNAAVRLAGLASIDSEGDMTTTLTLAPRTSLPNWEIV